MKYKIYIDNNDEITTIIEKLHAAQAVDVIMVVSQNSLLLQSVINIRLLKREAIKGRKKITLATHDEEGAALAEKVGIPVDRDFSDYAQNEELAEDFGQQERQSTPIAADAILNNISKEETSVLSTTETKGTEKLTAGAAVVQENKIMTKGPTMDGMVAPLPEKQHTQEDSPQSLERSSSTIEQHEKNLEDAWSSAQKESKNTIQNQSQDNEFEANLGTSQFFSASQKREQDMVKKDVQEQERSLINADLVMGASIAMEKNGEGDAKKKRNKAAPIITVQQSQQEIKRKQDQQITPQPIIDESAQNVSPLQVQNKKNDDATQKESLISDFYQQEKKVSVKQGGKKKTKSFHHGGHGIFARLTKIVVVLAIILAIVTSVFIFLPKTDMHIILKRATESVNLTITALTSVENVDIERRIIPGQMVAIDVEQTETFPATKEITSSEQKARGQVIIFNEFSTDPQPLVATTRLESSDGKIFRLVKGITVPGMKNDTPGEIKVDVVADEAGSDYDIDPDRFTIPGLSGSQKIEKIYGKSEESMRGGGSGGDGILAVSESDIEEAEKKMKESFSDSIRSQIADIVEQNGGGIFLEDTIEVGEIIGSASVAVETAVDTFDYTLRAPVRVITFSGDDITMILDAALVKKIDNESMTPEGTIAIVYGDAEAKYDKEELIIDTSGQGSYVANVDEVAFRSDVIGKTIEEITHIVHEKYSAIEKINFHFTPNIPIITNKLSTLDKMLHITFE